MQRFRQLAPLNGQRIHRRLTPFSRLLTELNREVNDRRNSDKDGSELTDGCEHCPVHLNLFRFYVRLTLVRSGNLTNTTGYFFSADAVADMAKSEFHISAAHFQFPSACFSHTSRYLPRSFIGLPLASFMISSYVPLTQAMAPLWPSFTLDGFQLITRPGAARTSFHTFRTVSFVAARVAFGGSTTAS